MYKCILLLYIFSFSFFSFSFADLLIDKSNDKPINVNTMVEIPPLGDLEYISVKFCDQGKVIDKKELLMQAGQTKDVCMIFFNTNTTGNTIKTITQFSQGNLQSNGVPNCSNDYSSGEFFDLIKPFTSGYFNITLAPGEKVIKHIKISLPKNLTGSKDIYGCAVYQLDQKKPTNFSGIFYVVNAKASYIHIQKIDGIYNRKNIDTIIFAWQDNKMEILGSIAVILVMLLVYYLYALLQRK